MRRSNPIKILALAAMTGSPLAASACDFQKGQAGDAAATSSTAASTPPPAAIAPPIASTAAVSPPLHQQALPVHVTDGGDAVAPWVLPSGFPTTLPPFPSVLPTALPSGFPTALPSGFPKTLPTAFPSSWPTALPSQTPPR